MHNTSLVGFGVSEHVLGVVGHDAKPSEDALAFPIHTCLGVGVGMKLT